MASTRSPSSADRGKKRLATSTTEILCLGPSDLAAIGLQDAWLILFRQPLGNLIATGTGTCLRRRISLVSIGFEHRRSQEIPHFDGLVLQLIKRLGGPIRTTRPARDLSNFPTQLLQPIPIRKRQKPLPRPPCPRQIKRHSSDSAPTPIQSPYQSQTARCTRDSECTLRFA